MSPRRQFLAWMTKDPYDACRKGRRAVEKAQREFSKPG